MGTQSRLVTGGGIPVQDALMDGLVNQSERRLEQRLRGGLILGVECHSQSADLMAQTGPMHAIRLRALARLLNAFQGGFVACHRLSSEKRFEKLI
jgi:hypothetical protein